MNKFITLVLAIGIAAVGGGWYWWQQRANALPSGIAKTNGRLEAEQVEIATKFAGRIVDVLATEGQLVNPGDVVAHMDTVQLKAQLAAANAQVLVAQHQLTQAQASIAQQDSQRNFAQKEFDRITDLKKKGYATAEQLDQVQNQSNSAQAAYDTAVASLEAAKATIAAQQAVVAQIQSQIDDFESGRAASRARPVQARPARGGAGGRRPGPHPA